MPKKLDPSLVEILSKYEESAEAALWDCHGTWVVYHKAIERIAAKAGITFDMPQIIEANSAGKTVAIAVRGVMGERSEWSFGEAAPSNNKNAYPYAMAEKRAKDRVVLKLVGLHGLAYSEEESDDFRPSGAAPAEPETKRQVGWSKDGTTRTAHSLRKEKVWEEFERELLECKTIDTLKKLALAWSTKAEADKWPASWKELAHEEINKRREVILNPPPVDDDDTFPGDRPSTFVNTLGAM